LRRGFRPHGASSAALGFSPQGDALFIGSTMFYRWDMNWLRQPFRDMSLRTLALPEALRGTSDYDWKLPFAVSFSRDGSTLTAAGAGATRVWNATTGKLKETLRSSFSLPTRAGKVTIAPDKKSVLVRDTAMATSRPMSPVGDAWFIAAAISRDGKVVGGASSYGFAHLWDARSGELLQTLTGHTGAVSALAFSPDNSTLATGSEDYTIRLWNVRTGKLLKTLEGHGGVVRALAFSANGSTLASIAADGSVKLWRVR